MCSRIHRRCLLPNVLFVAALWFGGKGLISLWNNAVYGQISWPFFSALTFLAVTVLGMLSVLFPLLFLPAVSALISTLLLEPMFKPYMQENAACEVTPPCCARC